MDVILGIPVSTLGMGGILSIVALLIFHGDLIPRRWHDKVVEDLIKDRDLWRKVAFEQTDQKHMILSERSLGATVLETLRDSVSGDANA